MRALPYGSSFSSRRGRKTASHSRPLARWYVSRWTPRPWDSAPKRASRSRRKSATDEPGGSCSARARRRPRSAWRVSSSSPRPDGRVGDPALLADGLGDRADRRGVAAVAQEPQRPLRGRPADERRAAHLERDAGEREGLLVVLRARVQAVEDGHLLVRHALAGQAAHLRDQERRLGEPVRLHEGQRLLTSRGAPRAAPSRSRPAPARGGSPPPGSPASSGSSPPAARRARRGSAPASRAGAPASRP